jgi:hypothetical protein
MYLVQMFVGELVTDFNAPSPAVVPSNIPVQADWQSADGLVSINMPYF